MKNQVKRNCLCESRSTWLTIFVSAALISSITFSGIDVVKALPPQNCLAVGGNGGSGGAEAPIQESCIRATELEPVTIRLLFW